MASRVQLSRLTRHYRGNDRPAVDALDLDVAEGEVLSLVGPSGCGKSTTLRMVAGLEQPDGGTIRIGVRDTTRLPPQERDVAMVFQGFALYPHMTVREILAFPLRMRKVPRAERARLVQTTAERLSIARLLDRKPGQLSGGEQQRVAMGRAIVRRPEVFLFDEPLSNLDAALRAELRVELGKLLRGLGATALYVTHDQAEAMTLSHRIAVLRAGRLEQLGTPREIYERPATRFVAGFFGNPPMNLLAVERDGAWARWGALKLPAPGHGPLLLGIRPEHVRVGHAEGSGFDRKSSADRDVGSSFTRSVDVAADPGADGHAAWHRGAPATVTALEPHGAETHLELSVGDQTLRARAPGFDVPPLGSVVRVSFPEQRVCWFDRDSGRAVNR